MIAVDMIANVRNSKVRTSKVRTPKILAFARAAILLAVALIVLAGPANAEAQKQPPMPSANAMKMAREIIDLKGSATLFTPLVAGVIERVKFMLLQTSPALRKDLDEVAASLRKQFASVTTDILTEVTRTYAAAFSEPELKEILAFYRTATGKKVIAQEPLIMEDAIAGIKPWQDSFGEDILARFRTEMKKRGHDL